MKIVRLGLLIATIFVSLHVSAQNSMQLVDATIEYDDAQRPCIQLNLDPEPKTLKRAWKEYLKDNYDFKLKGIGFLSNKDMLSAEEIVVQKISSKQMDFYTQIIEDENGSEMKVFVRYGYDVYVSKESASSDYVALKGIIDGFLKDYLPEYYAGKIKESEKRVKKLTKETNDLEEDVSDGTEKIAELKKEIEELEADLESNSESLEVAKRKLKNRKLKLERIKSQLKEL